MKIVVYAIAKNESSFVDRWMDSMSEADQVVVLDTGSTDGTAERLRALAYEDLDAAVCLGCEMSIEEMAERGLPVHPNTVKARDWLKTHRKGTVD